MKTLMCGVALVAVTATAGAAAGNGAIYLQSGSDATTAATEPKSLQL
jgi:hypothetical protein